MESLLLGKSRVRTRKSRGLRRRSLRKKFWLFAVGWSWEDKFLAIGPSSPAPTLCRIGLVSRSAFPAVRDETWPANPIDRFVLGKLESEGLSPSREAEPRTLLRRLSLD